MTRYLVFQLYAPLASWGEEAVGEVRHSSSIPTRSALLGLLAAAVGIKREEEARLNQFNQHYYVAVRALSRQESWLRDYHTVMMPRENKKRTYATRRDELRLAPEEVGTIVTQREYRCDAYYHIALKETPQAVLPLEALSEALVAPHFPLYLGRKACPLALPLSPRIIHGTLAEAFRQAERELPDPKAPGLASLITSNPECYWDDPEEMSITVYGQHKCADQPVSRLRWQFGDRIRFHGRLGEGG